MRADMAKVIVERPRYGSRDPARKKGYRKYVHDAGFENLPRREPMLGRWRGMGRWLNEHLGPMRRFLRSNVGRPWNKVHQELCEHVSFDNSVQKHVLTHVFQYVQQHVEVRGREIYVAEGWRRNMRLTAGEMYICPATGLLKVVRPHKTHRLPKSAPSGRNQQVHRRDAVWWELRLRPFPSEVKAIWQQSARQLRPKAESAWDVWLEREVTKADVPELKELYGSSMVAISMRLLTIKEVRQLHSRLAKQRTPVTRR